MARIAGIVTLNFIPGVSKSMTWPGDWISGAVKKANQESADFVNDNGKLFMCGNTREEYLWFDTENDIQTELRP